MMVIHLDRLTPYQGVVWDEQQEWSESEHCEKPNHGEEDEIKHSPRNKKWRYVCRLFGINRFKQGAM
jgi:hypothetical protein